MRCRRDRDRLLVQITTEALAGRPRISRRHPRHRRGHAQKTQRSPTLISNPRIERKPLLDVGETGRQSREKFDRKESLYAFRVDVLSECLRPVATPAISANLGLIIVLGGPHEGLAVDKIPIRAGNIWELRVAVDIRSQHRGMNDVG